MREKDDIWELKIGKLFHIELICQVQTVVERNLQRREHKRQALKQKPIHPKSRCRS